MNDGLRVECGRLASRGSASGNEQDHGGVSVRCGLADRFDGLAGLCADITQALCQFTAKETCL